VFDAIRARNWASAQAGIAVLPRSELAAVAKAELYTAKGSPKLRLDQLQALLAEAPDLPQAEQLARMAMSRGATNALIVPSNRLVALGSAPGRSRARPVSGEPEADKLRSQIDPLLKDNLAPDAEALFLQSLPYLSYEARAEASQRIAWTYYVIGRDLDARRLADSGRVGATGEWVSHSAWVSGLAAWRMGDCTAAAPAFRQVATTAVERELRAAGLYWAARAEQACRRPAAVAPLLKAAAALPDSFYGLVARETLGMATQLPPAAPAANASVDSIPNVRRAIALANIGERPLAEAMLRHQAKIGRPYEHRGLIGVAKQLDLAGAQYWLAHSGQPGATADASDRFPLPRWAPLRGWRIDPALALAHIRQESKFRAEVVSPAGAVGLMQVMPATAAAMAAQNGLNYSPAALFNPPLNMELGQSFIEKMRRSGATAGQLPRVIAAYNAGPLPVGRWASIYDKGDPLLWIESLSYWETRYYVPAVLRNLWVYQGLMNQQTPTLRAIAEHRWPYVPTGTTALASK
jgi:soluble lytic murein transglycosylase-like protein